MKTKVIAYNLFSERVLKKSSFFMTMCNSNGIVPSVNDYFDDLWNEDYSNEGSVFELVTQFYADEDGIMREALHFFRDFDTRYPNFKDYYSLLSKERREKIDEVNEFAREYREFVDSGKINELSNDELYVKYLEFQYDFYSIFGTKKFDDLASGAKAKLNAIEDIN